MKSVFRHVPRTALIVVAVLFAALGIFGTRSVWAAQDIDPAQLNESHISQISTNCRDALPRIQQVQRIDRATRLNQSGLFTSIQDLMTRFNGRAVLNKVDASHLIELSNVMISKVETYRSDYQKYDLAISNLAQFQNCETQPTIFYASLTQVRGMRAQLARDVAEIEKIITEYRQQVKNIQQETGATS